MTLNQNEDINLERKDKKLSKALSWVLRHSATKIGLPISSDGYIPVVSLLSLKARSLNAYSSDDITRVVEHSDKKRFKLEYKKVRFEKNGKYEFLTGSQNERSSERFGEYQETLCIRANQGHSMSGIRCEDLLTRIDEEELKSLTIIHGTFYAAWDQSIQNEGLKKMSRNHIHFATKLPTDKLDMDQESQVISGVRWNSEVYIYINGELCARDGIIFYRSDNGVLLTSGPLPTKYFLKVIDAKTGQALTINSRILK